MSSVTVGLGYTTFDNFFHQLHLEETSQGREIKPQLINAAVRFMLENEHGLSLILEKCYAFGFYIPNQYRFAFHVDHYEFTHEFIFAEKIGKQRPRIYHSVGFQHSRDAERYSRFLESVSYSRQPLDVMRMGRHTFIVQRDKDLVWLKE